MIDKELIKEVEGLKADYIKQEMLKVEGYSQTIVVFTKLMMVCLIVMGFTLLGLCGVGFYWVLNLLRGVLYGG